MKLENKILRGLIADKNYKSTVLPFLKSEYFTNEHRVVYELILAHVEKYGNSPTPDILQIELDASTGLSQPLIDSASDVLVKINKDESFEEADWLQDATEEFCKDKALYNAITESIEIINDSSGKFDRGMIPDILNNALAVSFDTNVGHDWLEDWEERYDFYHLKEDKIAFDLDYFNKITKNGVSPKSLNIIMAGTGVGKSMLMCHFATNYLQVGKNVLYISMEMSEEKISERIDANMMNLEIDDVKSLSKSKYGARMEKFGNHITGKLITKEYPTASASVLNFRALLTELKLKKAFVPDVIFIDYLNICASSRVRMGANSDTYTYVKMIAEELRGLAVEMKIPIWSATQVNRQGHENSDVGLENTSESFGLPATADLMFAAITNEELEAAGQIMIKQLKNRYNDLNYMKRGIIGVNKAKMKFFDVSQGSQVSIQSVVKNSNTKPSFAPTIQPTSKSITNTSLKDKFQGLKV